MPIFTFSGANPTKIRPSPALPTRIKPLLRPRPGGKKWRVSKAPKGRVIPSRIKETFMSGCSGEQMDKGEVVEKSLHAVLPRSLI